MKLYGESDPHKAGKERFRQILRNNGFEVDAEERIGTIGPAAEHDADKPHPYSYDVYAEGLFSIACKPNYHSLMLYVRIVGEVDGRVGHKKSPDNSKKDKKREGRIELYEQGKPVVIRIDTEDLVGKKKLTDEEIWQDIQFKVKEGLKRHNDRIQK